MLLLFIVLVVLVLVVVVVVVLFLIRWKRQQQRNIISASSLRIRKCPNPNCIRCQRYQSVQRNAQRRLPYLIREWQTTRNVDATTTTTIFDKIMEGVRSGPPPLPEDEEEELSLFRRRRIRKNAIGQYPTVFFVPNLSVNTIVTHLHEEVCRFFASTTRQETLLEEYLASQFNGGLWQVNDSDKTTTTTASSNDELWEALYLLNQGRWIKENTRSCCKTYSLIKELLSSGSMMDGCMFGNIFFSVLYPGTQIEEHCGPTNVRHRLHVPLLVPKQSGRQQPPPSLTLLSSSVLQWTEKEPFVFDDSLVHAAQYPDTDASEVRVVFIMDLWHPDLTLPERQMILDLFPA